MAEWFYNWVWIQQDYLWFVAGLSWLYVGALWWQGRKDHELPGWVLCSAAAGVLMAVVEIATIASPSPTVQGQPPSLPGDMVLGFVAAGLAVSWWAVGLRGQRGRAVLVSLVAVIALLSAAWRYDNPAEGTVVISLMLAGAAAWWLFSGNPDARAWNTPLVVATLASLLSTTGPLAYALEITRRWADASALGPWAALAQIAAGCTVMGFWHHQQRKALVDVKDFQADRWFYVGAGAWMIVGLFLAILAGNSGRKAFEQNALTRLVSLTNFLPKGGFSTLLDDQLDVGKPETYTFPNGGHLEWAPSEHAARYGTPVANQLTEIAKANPDVDFVSLLTIRNEWLLLAASAYQPADRARELTLLRRATSIDSNDWALQSEDVGLQHFLASTWVLAKTPVRSPDGEMLGWLMFAFRIAGWVAAQAQARSLAYAIIGLGLVVGRLLVVQRHRSRERDRAHKAADAATNANRLKTTFLANVSHELRTPLQTIMGYADMLLPKLPVAEREKLMAVREHADLMGRLVNDLIDLSCAESGNFKLVVRPVALTDQVVKTAESLRARAEAKGLGLSISAAPEIPGWVMADAQRLRQVVINLVGNAIKYTDHGSVDVSLALVGRNTDSVEVELRVCDTGPGIPLPDQPHLFDAFQRLDLTSEKEGTGLGLAIVRAICLAMNGSIRVESDGRTGSCFVARLRFLLAAAPAPAAPQNGVPLRGKRVLIADDNVLVRDLFVAFLTDCGAICATAGDGEEALRRLRTEGFDAVVLDLAMPKLDGIATVRRLRQEMPEQHWRVVGVSAHASGTEHQEALAAGMDAFLVKPVQLPELAQALSPEIRWIPPNRSFDQMRAHFEQRFRADAAAQRASVARAWERGEWKEIHAAAHYLKNSADVVGDGQLARACASLEAAARARDYVAGTEAWRECRHALARWVTEPSAN